MHMQQHHGIITASKVNECGINLVNKYKSHQNKFSVSRDLTHPQSELGSEEAAQAEVYKVPEAAGSGSGIGAPNVEHDRRQACYQLQYKRH